MNTFIIVLCVLAYIAVALCSFFFYWKGKENTMFEKIWFSALWPLNIPGALVHWIHNGKNAKF